MATKNLSRRWRKDLASPYMSGAATWQAKRGAKKPIWKTPRDARATNFSGD